MGIHKLCGQVISLGSQRVGTDGIPQSSGYFLVERDGEVNCIDGHCGGGEYFEGFAGRGI